MKLNKLRYEKKIKPFLGNVGMDKAVIKGFKIVSTDIEKLRELGFKISTEGRYGRRVIDEKKGELNISFIKGETARVKKINISTNIKDGVGVIETSFLECTLPRMIDKKHGLNLLGIMSGEELKEAFEEIKRELSSYGLKISLDEAKFEELEVNTTIELEKEPDEYKKSLEYVRRLFPKTLKSERNGVYYDEKEGYLGSKVWNKSRNKKFYFKNVKMLRAGEIEEGEEIPTLLRIEDTYFKGSIKNKFFSNKLVYFIENFDKVVEVYQEQQKKDWINKVDKQIQKDIIECEKLLVRYREVKAQNYTDSVLKNHYLLDVEILLKALKSKVRSNHFSREARRTITSALEIQREKMVDNIYNFNEILSKLEQQKIEIELTQSIKNELQKYTS